MLFIIGRKKLDIYINSIDKHIKTDRVLPTDTYITLAYKNTSDAEKYNLTTGKRLKDYLAKTYITIIATIEYDNLTLSKNFDINIGYVGVSISGQRKGTCSLWGSNLWEISVFQFWRCHVYSLRGNVYDILLFDNSISDVIMPYLFDISFWIK